jgi:hypothetical protein
MMKPHGLEVEHMAMSDEHKAALAQGRKEARAIKLYLEVLAARKPGRPVTPDRLKNRIATLEAKIATEADPMRALEMRQSRLEAEAALAKAPEAVDMETLEAGFVGHARVYGDRKGISYAAWREQGVPAAVLSKAGIARTRSS